MNHLDLETLSQLHDDELAAAAAVAAHEHLGTCAACRARADRLAEIAAAVSTFPPSALAARGDACLAPSAIAGWVARALDGAARRTTEAHLETCTACLAEALDAARTMARLAAAPRIAVPATLTARVASRWAEPAPSLTTLVLRLGQRAVALVERHLAAPFADLEAGTLAAPALRAVDTPEGLSFTLRAPAVAIEVTAVPVDDAVALTLTLRDALGATLPGQRTFLRHHGRPMYSARSDTDGSVRLPRIERGVYEVSCPGVGIAFRLDLRAEQ